MTALMKVRDKDGKIREIQAVVVPGLVTPHADTHRPGGGDPITPESIGAARMVSGSYVGDGGYGRTMTVDVPVKLLFIMEDMTGEEEHDVTAYGALLFLTAGVGLHITDSEATKDDQYVSAIFTTITAVADGWEITWRDICTTDADEGRPHMNSDGKTYRYIGFG